MLVLNGKVKKSTLLLVFFLLSFFRPECIAELYADSFLGIVFIVFRLVSTIMIAIKFISGLSRKETGLYLITVFEILLLLSCIYNNVSLNSRLIDIGNFIGIYMMFSYYSKHDSNQFIEVCFEYFFVIIVINGILTILFPNGLNHALSNSSRINFLGKDNVADLTFTIGLMFSFLYLKRSSSKKPIFLISIITITELYYMSATAVISMVVFYVIYLLVRNGKQIHIIFSPKVLLISFGIIYIMLVFLKNVSYFSFLFEIFSKSSNFSDRFYYWDIGISRFLSSPYIGLGSGVVDLWGNNYYSHNAALDILLKGGILGLVAWLIMLYVPLNKIWNNNYMCNEYVIICVSVIPFLLIGLMEGLEDRVMFNAFVAIAYCAPYLK